MKDVWTCGGMDVWTISLPDLIVHTSTRSNVHTITEW